MSFIINFIPWSNNINIINVINKALVFNPFGFLVLHLYIIHPVKANTKIKEKFKINVYKSLTLPLKTSNKKYRKK